MKCFLVAVAVILLSMGANAAEQTVTLTVKNMTCVSCPYIVKQALAGVTGVREAKASLADKTVEVVFDDAKTTVAALIEATTNAGFPAQPLQ
jgi:mercuric ion binding protein